MIGIIFAMEKELAPYISGREFDKKVIGNKSFYFFNINGKNCVAVHSGVGKVNSAYATGLLINCFSPEYVISTGVSGGLGVSELLETVVSTSCVQYDVDTSALGDEIGFVSTVNKTYFECDKDLTATFIQKAGLKSGILASGDKFVADKTTAEFIVNNFNAVACDMESGAIAQVAYITKTPFVAIRCISDGADDNAPISFDKLTDVASNKLYYIVSSVI